MSEQAIGQRMLEEMVLEQLLEAFPLITGRTVTEEWEGAAERVEGSPDFIIGFDGEPFGVELTMIMNGDDPGDYIAEAYRLASKKSESYTRRNIFRFPIALVMYSEEPPLFEAKNLLKDWTFQPDFEALGFTEVWSVDFSDAYYSAGHPFRLPDMFCFKPSKWFGFYRIDHGFDRKPYG